MVTEIIPEIMTEKYLADYLHVSVSKLQKWRYEGGGPPWFKVRQAVRYRKKDVDRWIEKGIVE